MNSNVPVPVPKYTQASLEDRSQMSGKLVTTNDFTFCDLSRVFILRENLYDLRCWSSGLMALVIPFPLKSPPSLPNDKILLICM